MQRARTHGALLADEAAYQLHLIFLWYENSPQQALALLQHAGERSPRQSDLPAARRRRARCLRARSRGVARRVSHAARGGAGRQGRGGGASGSGSAARHRASARRDGRHRSRDRRARQDPARAIPPRRFGAAAEARLLLAAAYDRVGARKDAERLYREVIAAPPPRDPAGVALRARRGLARAPDAVKAQAYGLSLEAWRQFQRGGPAAAAEERLERALAMDPQNTIARYRYGRVLMARHQDARRARAARHGFARAVTGAADDAGGSGAGGGARCTSRRTIARVRSISIAVPRRSSALPRRRGHRLNARSASCNADLSLTSHVLSLTSR